MKKSLLALIVLFQLALFLPRAEATFLTQLDTETLSNQDISSALLVGTFTNTTRIRKLFVNVFLDQVAGDGIYYAHLTIQRAGAGSAYATNTTAFAAASGVTAITFESMPITLNATDVLKVYVLGLVGDTTTPDIIYDLNEELPDDAATIAGIIQAASGQCPGLDNFAIGLRPAGHQQLTVSNKAVTLTVPTSLTVRFATVVVQADAIRTRDDGTAPTASIGTPWAVASRFFVCQSSLAALQMIRQTTDATLDIDYYGD